MALMELSRENFQETFDQSQILIIDFWASWCGPCRGFAPTFEAAAKGHPDATFAKCNTEEQQDLAAAFGIRSIPTLAIFREKILVFKQAGALPKPAFEDLIKQVKELDMVKIKAEIEAEQAKAEQAEAPAKATEAGHEV